MNGAAAGWTPDRQGHQPTYGRSPEAAPAPGGREYGSPSKVQQPGAVIAPAGHPAAYSDRGTRPTTWHRRAALDEESPAEAARAAAARNARSAGGTLRKARSVAFGAASPLRAVLGNLTGRTVSSSQPPRRRPKLGVGRLLCWQLAAVAVIASIDAPRAVTVAVMSAVAATMLATTIRVRGRLLYEWGGRAWRYLLRPHRAALDPRLPAQDLVDMIGDHARVVTVEIDDIPVAFIHQADGVSAVLEIHTSRDVSDTAWTSLLSVSSLLPVPDAAAPPFGAQLIMQTATSTDLSALHHDNRGPGRRAWLTVQAVRTSEIYQTAELTQALSNAVQRMMRRLARDDIPTRTLNRDETLNLVLALAQLDPAEVAGPLRVTETWTAWEAGATLQASFRLHGWQEASDATRQLALRRLELIPSRGTTMAIAARRRGRYADSEADCDVTVRLTERDRPRLENSAHLLAFALQDVPAIRPERLDGDHLAALAASLPLGAQSVLH